MTQRLHLPSLIAVLGLFAGCRPAPATGPAAPPAAEAKGDSDARGLAATPTSTDAPALREPDLARMLERTVPGVHDRVPAALTTALVFEPRLDAKRRLAVAIPKGWINGPMSGSFVPPPESGLGLGTMVSFGTGCDGRCAPKDWPAAFAKVEVQSMPVQKIESDEQIGNNGRIVVAQVGAAKQIVAGLWKPGADRYFWCRATLDGPLVDATAAFAMACRGMEIGRWE